MRFHRHCARLWRLNNPRDCTSTCAPTSQWTTSPQPCRAPAASSHCRACFACVHTLPRADLPLSQSKTQRSPRQDPIRRLAGPIGTLTARPRHPSNHRTFTGRTFIGRRRPPSAAHSSAAHSSAAVGHIHRPHIHAEFLVAHAWALKRAFSRGNAGVALASAVGSSASYVGTRIAVIALITAFPSGVARNWRT